MSNFVRIAAASAFAAALCMPATGQVRDTTARPGIVPRTPGQLGGQSMNPDISAIGELLTDLSPGRAKTTSNGERFDVREVELGIQAVVDPFFRADFFIGLHPEVVEIEEAYLTALDLPGGFQGRIGRFHVPIGKVNLIHRPEQITVDYPWMIRDFFGDEGLGSNGIGLSRIFAPLGFFQELLVYGVGSLGGGEHAHGEEEEQAGGFIVEAPDNLRNQVALIAQLRNYWDLSLATNLEVGVSGAAGRLQEFEQLACGLNFQDPCAPGQTPARREIFVPQKYYGAHLTARWRPPQQGLYRSLIWNNEVLVNDSHEGKLLGLFSQAQWQLTRRVYLGGRFDAVQRLPEDAHEHEAGEAEEELEKNWFKAGSGYLTFFPSEFSRWKLAAERTFGRGDPTGGEWRIVLQTTFAIGPHRPHAF